MEQGDRVLIIEDDPRIAEVVAVNLADIGLRAERASDGRAGLAKALAGGWALIILDLMLPGLGGQAVCARIREKDPFVPLMMLTARSEEADRVAGLEIGADEYVTKPFSVRELQARVKALLRRVQADRDSVAGRPSGGRLEIAGIVMDFDRRRVNVHGRPVELTVKEFELLALFARNPGRAYSRTELLNLVWGYQFEGYEHTVNSHINRLRAKIEKNPARPSLLQTVWGIGYRFADPGDAAPADLPSAAAAGPRG
jgi:DNA-binding response OmpR family regulator